MCKNIVNCRFLVCLLFVLSCLVVCNVVVPNEVEAQEDGDPLVHYFKVFDEPNYDGINATWERYPMEMLAAQLPFELQIPELAGWNLDDQRVLYVTSYTKRFFHSVYLTYQKDGVDLDLTVALHRKPF